MTEISCWLTNFYYENLLFEIYISGQLFWNFAIKNVTAFLIKTSEIENSYIQKSSTTIWGHFHPILNNNNLMT